MSTEAWVTFWLSFAALAATIVIAVFAVVWRQGAFEGTTTEKVESLEKGLDSEKQSRFKRDSDVNRVLVRHDERIKRVETHVAVHEDREERDRSSVKMPKRGDSA